jgi:hypothetical protein
MHILGGIVGIIVGFLLIRYAIPLTDSFGRIGWAEEHLRGGLAGTYSLYKIVGLAFILLSLLYMFGGIGFILSPFGSVFGAAKQ